MLINKEIKYFVCSEVLDSSQLPNLLKESLYKEKSSYRRTIIASEIGADFYKDASEITKEKMDYFEVDENGEFLEEVSQIDVVSFDLESWRYFFIPKDLDELGEMIDFIKFDIIISFFDPNKDDELTEIKRVELERSIGIPLHEEKFMVLTILDNFLLDKIKKADILSEEIDDIDDDDDDDEEEEI